MSHKKLQQKNRKNRQGGFSLMETLVAIFILLLALTGPMVFAQYGLRSAFLARDQITAFFLAQDAIEYIKNIRNGNVVEIVKHQGADPAGWLNYNGQSLFNEDICGPTNGCSIDTRKKNNDGLGDIKSCTAQNIGCVNDVEPNSYTPLNYYHNEQDNISYFTTEDANGGNIKPSIFAREIKIKEIKHTQQEDNTEMGNLEAEITVIVRWKSHEGIGVRQIVVRENITNWAHALLSTD